MKIGWPKFHHLCSEMIAELGWLGQRHRVLCDVQFYWVALFMELEIFSLALILKHFLLDFACFISVMQKICLVASQIDKVWKLPSNMRMACGPGLPVDATDCIFQLGDFPVVLSIYLFRSDCCFYSIFCYGYF